MSDKATPEDAFAPDMWRMMQVIIRGQFAGSGRDEPTLENALAAAWAWRVQANHRRARYLGEDNNAALDNVYREVRSEFWRVHRAWKRAHRLQLRRRDAERKDVVPDADYTVRDDVGHRNRARRWLLYRRVLLNQCLVLLVPLIAVAAALADKLVGDAETSLSSGWVLAIAAALAAGVPLFQQAVDQRRLSFLRDRLSYAVESVCYDKSVAYAAFLACGEPTDLPSSFKKDPLLADLSQPNPR